MQCLVPSLGRGVGGNKAFFLLINKLSDPYVIFCSTALSAVLLIRIFFFVGSGIFVPDPDPAILTYLLAYESQSISANSLAKKFSFFVNKN